MSVFTRVDRHSLEHFLTRFDQGRLESFKGVSEGIENTNYFVTTSRGAFVLTLIEQWPAPQVPYFINLMAWLAERGIPSARPIADRSGQNLHTLLGKPAALVERLAGESTEEPTIDHCHAVGKVLADLHIAGQDFPGQRPDHRGIEWRAATVQRLVQRLDPADLDCLQMEMDHYRSLALAQLPRGVIHADLFPDNVLLREGEISGVIDFYYACNDVWIYDVAITANQWCASNKGQLCPDKLSALLQAYNGRRPLLASERAVWPAMLRYGALRFWISRLQDKLFPKQGHLTTVKDPDAIRKILLDRQATQEQLLEMWDTCLN